MSRAQRPSRSEDELRAISGHLRNEIEMMSACVRALATVDHFALGPARTPVRNALLSFLYNDGRSSGDDATATDFIAPTVWRLARGAKPDVLRLAHQRSSQEIAHLSYRRIAPGDDDRAWHIEPILVQLGDALHRFIEKAPPSSLQTDFVARATRALPKQGATMTKHASDIAARATSALRRDER